MSSKVDSSVVQQHLNPIENISSSECGNSKIQETACSRILSHLSSVKKTFDAVICPVKILRDEIETARMAKLATALNLKLSGPSLGTPLAENGRSEIFDIRAMVESALANPVIDRKEVETWLQDVAALADKINGFNGQASQGTLDQIRSEMSRLMGPVYQNLIETDLPAVNFLQILSIKLQAADGEPLLAAHARRMEVGIQPEKQYPVSSLADTIKSKLKQFDPFSHNQDTKLNRVWWIVNHPLRALHSLESEFSPMTYNPNHGNPSYLGPRFARTVGDRSKSLQAYYGPAPTGDRIYEFGVLPAYRKFGLFEIYFNYQDASHASEKTRIGEIARIAAKAENKDCLKHVVLGFDAKVVQKQIKQLIQSYNTVEEFVGGYSNFVIDGSRDLNGGAGIEIPHELLNDEQLKGIFSSASEFFIKMGVPEKLDAPDTNKKDLAEMMVMDIDARIAAAILYQAFEKVPSHPAELDKDLATCYVSARCKQHIDRGAVQSNALRIYFRMFEDDSPLSQKEFEEICGGILGRAPGAENRNILFKRYKRFDSLMRLIGSRHAELAQSLRVYRDQYLKRQLQNSTTVQNRPLKPD